LTDSTGIGNVLCLEDTFSERADNITTCYELSGASEVHYSVSTESRHKVCSSLDFLLSNHYLDGMVFRLTRLCRHLATCSADHTIKLWSTSNYEYTLERTLTGHQRWVWDAAFSADSAYLVTGQSGSTSPPPPWAYGEQHHRIMPPDCGI